ncbi:MAG: hypothetical protein JNL12_18615 [Planctomycetes bacterium]|nr:hypothetical protein [Planctomycetota bacterium]
MPRPSTLVVLLDAFVARAELRWRRGRCEVVQCVRQARGSEPVVERLDRLLAEAPGRGDLVVLCDELFLQPLELSPRAIGGLSARDLAAAIELEAQGFSGLGSDVVTAWSRPGGDRHFVVAQGSRGDVAACTEVVERSGARLVGLAHPGALPVAMRSGSPRFVRLEEWSGQRFLVRGNAGRIERLRAWTGAVAQGENDVPTEHLAPRPVPGDGLASFDLGDESVLQRWLAHWAEAIAEGADVLLLRPPEPASARHRRVLFGVVLFLLAAVLAWLDRSDLQQEVLAANARLVASRAPLDRLQALENEIASLEQRLAAPIPTAPSAPPVAPWSTATVVAMLDAVATLRPTGVIVDLVEFGWQRCHLRGLAVEPLAADRFAEALAPVLRDEGYLVQPGPRETVVLPGGTLCSFELDLVSFVPPQPAVPKPAQPGETR